MKIPETVTCVPGGPETGDKVTVDDAETGKNGVNTARLTVKTTIIDAKNLFHNRISVHLDQAHFIRVLPDYLDINENRSFYLALPRLVLAIS